MPSDTLDDALASIARLRDAYRSGAVAPEAAVTRVYERIERHGAGVFISVRPLEEVLDELRSASPSRRASPLFGVPFAVKDNIDVVGLRTTCACPEFAYEPGRSASVVERLAAAGATPIGKTNLDQFATGIAGTRSPYGVPPNARHPDYVPGGSSSGSAVAVARGLAAFSLGTDTGGSGRVPAALNGIFGLKPSPGVLSTRGVFPNCPSLDCVSLFTRTVEDASLLLELARGYDVEDPWSARDAGHLTPARAGDLRFGVLAPDQREHFGDDAQARAYDALLERLRAAGAAVEEVDFAPYAEAGRLLFDGPWIAERAASFGEFVTQCPGAVLPILRAVLESAKRHSAVDAFRARHRLAALRRAVERDFEGVDLLVFPTVPTVYTLGEMEADPIARNDRLGHYTYFANLLDLSAMSVPVGSYPSGLPIGATIYGPRLAEGTVLEAAKRYFRSA